MQLKNVIAHDLNEMDIWSNKWLMSFNPDKTEIMIFSNRSVPENLDFSFNGKSVPITTYHTTADISQYAEELFLITPFCRLAFK
jgi:hypothetical protein